MHFATFRFQNGGRPPSGICLGRIWTIYGELGGLYRCAKFGCDQCSSFDNMKDSIFCSFGLKMPKLIHTPKVEF